jgi:hypothetical protein
MQAVRKCVKSKLAAEDLSEMERELVAMRVVGSSVVAIGHAIAITVPAIGAPAPIVRAAAGPSGSRYVHTSITDRHCDAAG